MLRTNICYEAFDIHMDTETTGKSKIANDVVYQGVTQRASVAHLK